MFVPIRNAPVELVERILCVAADFVLAGDGRHLVRFEDRSAAWVSPSWAWKYSPDTAAPSAA